MPITKLDLSDIVQNNYFYEFSKNRLIIHFLDALMSVRPNLSDM